MAGGGAIAESKIATLLKAGAKIRVAAPEATPAIQRWARQGKITWLRRRFRFEDLKGCLLVVAATSSRNAHEQIRDWARSAGVLCNVVDVPELCDFYYPACVRRGALQIAISTGGESPALAQRLRKDLGRQFGPDYAAWLAHLGESRRRLHETEPDAGMRKRMLHKEASAQAFAAFRKKKRSQSGKFAASRR